LRKGLYEYIQYPYAGKTEKQTLNKT